MINKMHIPHQMSWLKWIFALDRKIWRSTLAGCITVLLEMASAPGYSWEDEAFNAQSLSLDLINRFPEYPEIKGDTPEETAQLRRGEYMTRLGDCIACHTAKEASAKPFSGGLAIPTPFGTFYTPNITPDKETGLGQWSLNDFKRAMREGKDPKGNNYFPAFPYVYFNLITDSDLADIWAYLQAIPAINRPDRGDTLPFPVNVRLFQSVWKWMYFRPLPSGYEHDNSKSASWNRGRYIVEGAGHCAMCHSPLNMLGAEKKAYHLSGAFVEGYWAPDITRHGLDGVPHFEVADVFIEDKLINNAGKVRGPMAEANHDSLRYLTKKDQDAIVEYLLSIKSLDPRGITDYKDQQDTLKSGHRVFSNVCSICHVNGETGAPRIGDQAAWKYRLTSKGINALYRHARDGYNKMPIRGACLSCTDKQINNAVDYMLYHSFGSSYWNEFKHSNLRNRPHRTSVELGQKIYKENCAICHDSGKDGAPRIGDIKAWTPILKNNMEILITRTMQGYKSMPEKGGCKDCTQSEVISAVKYLVQHSQEGRDFNLW